MRGDMDRWLSLVHIAPDFTLMQPFGGPASRGFNASPERLAEMAKIFPKRRHLAGHRSCLYIGACVVLVMIERQQAELGGLPKQNWSLRVTEVYRKANSDWRLVHRHADPLVSRITIHEAATLARGGREEHSFSLNNVGSGQTWSDQTGSRIKVDRLPLVMTPLMRQAYNFRSGDRPDE